MTFDPLTVVVVSATMLLISFTKGAFGGGFAIIGIPMMALVMDPISAGALLAPLFIFSDIAAARYWKASTWSKPDLAILLPGQAVGVLLGYLVLRYTDRNLIAVGMALITLAFALQWLASGGKVTARPRSVAKGVACGIGSGMTSMIAHAGGPPVSMYLLPLGLPKAIYAGTIFMFFVVGNLLKAGPWLLLAPLSASEYWWLLALSLPAIWVGVWIGWRLHERLDQRQMYRVCYGLLVVVALKLLWDGLRGYGLV